MKVSQTVLQINLHVHIIILVFIGVVIPILNKEKGNRLTWNLPKATKLYT